MTMGPAFAAFQEHNLGQIAVGRYADFTVVSSDPYTLVPEALRTLKVRMTVVAGPNHVRRQLISWRKPMSKTRHRRISDGDCCGGHHAWYRVGCRIASRAGGQTGLKKDFISPARGRFSGAVVVHGGGMKTIYVSGHTGRGDDLKAQAIAAYEGVVKDLAAAGAKPEDVVKLNTYIANYTHDDRASYEEAKRKVFAQDDMPASTMVGVQSLISPQNRIEVEAVAIIPER